MLRGDDFVFVWVKTYISFLMIGISNKYIWCGFGLKFVSMGWWNPWVTCTTENFEVLIGWILIKQKVKWGLIFGKWGRHTIDEI